MSASYPLIPADAIAVRPDASLMRTIKAIDATDARIALVIDKSGQLLGSVTDGDIRRGLLRGQTLKSPVRGVMNKKPYTLPFGTPLPKVMEALQSQLIKQVPLLMPNGKIAGIAVYESLAGLKGQPRPNAVVIMAGGKGKRLLPITKEIPKPMVEVAGRPMLEWIIQRFVQQGFGEFHLAVNYKAEIIEDYFGNGKKFGCEIHYVREKQFLGTAGALSLLDARQFRHPIVVINGDIMASVDFGNVVDYHQENRSVATICARSHRVEIPFGVITAKGDMLTAITEKPVREEMVSAGIYVIEPEALKRIPAGKPLDMPALLLSLVKQRKKVGVFPMPEEWADVGRHDDLKQIQKKFQKKRRRA